MFEDNAGLNHSFRIFKAVWRTGGSSLKVILSALASCRPQPKMIEELGRFFWNKLSVNYTDPHTHTHTHGEAEVVLPRSLTLWESDLERLVKIESE